MVTAPNQYSGKIPALVPQDIKTRSNWDILTKTPQEYASDKTPPLGEKVQSEPRLPNLGARGEEGF